MARQAGVPAFIANRPKSGFGILAPGWADRGGVLEPLVAVAAKATGEDALRDLQSGPTKSPMLFWNMLNYGLWKRLCIDREPSATLIAEAGLPEAPARPR